MLGRCSQGILDVVCRRCEGMLKIVFKDFPEMKTVISELDTDQFYKDPAMLIKKFDEAK